MLNSYFTSSHQVLIVITLLLYFVSVIFFEFSNKQSLALLLLLLGTFVFKLFVISLDAFVNLWDEQFHALVAKNMTNDLLNPKLFSETVVPYNYRLWYQSPIWMHRPPLFLMQMALSLKLFGLTSFAVRLPSALCFTFSVFCVYRIGVNLVTQRIGYLSALLFSANYFFNELLAGAEPADHNDIVFMCYGVASIWAFTEYYFNARQSRWMVLNALFCSFAVLTKGAFGFLVFLIWVTILFQEKNSFRNKSAWFDFLKTLGMAIILPLSWYFYSTCRFPVETGVESENYLKQLSVPIEGHKGTELFYFENLIKTIGYYAPFFILPGIVLLRDYIKNKITYGALICAILVVFIFFNYSKTKITGSTIPVYFIFFLGFGTLLEYVYQKLNLFSSLLKRIIFCALIMYTGILLCNIESLQRNHTYWNREEFWLVDRRSDNIDWHNTCQKLKEELKGDKYVIFNCDEGDHIKLMFYTDHIAYEKIPTQRDLYSAKSKGLKVAAVDRGNLPQNVMDNQEIVKFRRMRDRVVSIDSVIIRISDNRYFSRSEWNGLVAGAVPMALKITTFADGYIQLKDMNNKAGSIDYPAEGFITFVHDRYELYEKFKLTPTENGKYRITTFFGDNLALDEGDSHIQVRRHEKKVLEVELMKYKISQ